jgi:hypothetical protein
MSCMADGMLLLLVLRSRSREREWSEDPGPRSREEGQCCRGGEGEDLMVVGDGD